jgi:hypothetical protein
VGVCCLFSDTLSMVNAERSQCPGSTRMRNGKRCKCGEATQVWQEGIRAWNSEKHDIRRHGRPFRRQIICRHISQSASGKDTKGRGIPARFYHRYRTARPWLLSNSTSTRLHSTWVFRVARRTEGLPNLGTGLSSLPTLQSPSPHSYPTARFHAASSPFLSYSHRPHKSASNVSWFHTQSHCSRPLHTMYRSHPHSRHHSRNRGTHPLDRIGCPQPSPPTRDVSLSPNSSTFWPNYAEFNFPEQPPIILRPTDSWNAYTAHWRQPSCATQVNIGQRHFPSSF